LGEGTRPLEGWQKAKEARLRRLAARLGYRITRCRRRDPAASGHGTYLVVDDAGRVAAGDPIDYGLTLDDVETWLGQRPSREPRI
jgi:hypothetical protein